MFHPSESPSVHPSALGAIFRSDTRLYDLEGPGLVSDLLVECWQGREGLSQLYEWQVTVLSLDATLDLGPLLDQPLSLMTRLADGSQVRRSGLVRTIVDLDADGGFARYRLILVPWFWYATQAGKQRLFVEKPLLDVLGEVFAPYASLGSWTATPEVASFLSSTRIRSLVTQSRETDYTFATRLLAEEGLGFCFVEDGANPGRQQLVIFADSVRLPEDGTSMNQDGGKGIRFHRSGSQEVADAIQALGSERQLLPGQTTVLTWDYHGKRAISANVPTHRVVGGTHAPVIEAYDYAGPYAWASNEEAQRYATLHQEALEARYKRFFGRSTVRSFRPGTLFDLTHSTLDALQQFGQDEKDRKFLLLEAEHVGINNLPKDVAETIKKCLGDALERQNKDAEWHADFADMGGEDLAGAHRDFRLPMPPKDLLAQAKKTGYGNAFTAIRSYIPWRPCLIDETGVRANPKPTADGMQTAIVVGPNGEAQASGADEIHMDRMGRIKIRFHWGQGSEATTWVRVAQRWAGAGMGCHFIPRIGQEVLVQFWENDIDRPFVIGVLYNGQGEGGIAPTTGGKPPKGDTTDLYALANDQRPSAQGNLIAGNGPAWHGASQDEKGHRNASALSGIKSKEFGGVGFNQLAFDDTPEQLRIQAKSTQAATELNFGHLLHQQDNFRGSFRGLGFELRTDAYGAVRGGQGVFITTYGIQDTEPAGDATAAIAQAKQLKTFAKRFSDAARTHQTVKLANAIGSREPDKSVIDPERAPNPALQTIVSGMVDAKAFGAAKDDAQGKNISPSEGKLPHTTDPVVTIAAKAGLGLTAGQDIQVAAAETITLASGADTNFAIGQHTRIHSGQAIGILAGAVEPGQENRGIEAIAAKDPIDVQAQADTLTVAAKQDIKIASAKAHIDWAAAKKIVLATEGGATLIIEGGNVTFKCPGTITVHASKKSFEAPAREGYAFPDLPAENLELFSRQFTLEDEKTGEPFAEIAYFVRTPEERVYFGYTDNRGMTQRIQTRDPKSLRIHWGEDALRKKRAVDEGQSY